MSSKNPLIRQVGMILQYPAAFACLISTGDCKIEVSSKQRHACTWDVLRATIDVLLGTCLDGGVGLGGVASARPFDTKDPTSQLKGRC